MSYQRALLIGVGFSLVVTGLIWALGDRLASFVLRPDLETPYWYPWVTASPTGWTRFSVWGLYLSHQISIWWLIWRAQSAKLKYGDRLHAINYVALATNAVFVVLHLLQTHLFYDGLAVDVSEQSSQWSVILLLVMILLMENRRRGLFFGQPVGGRIMEESARALRKYHGYYFAWATIYTFWYHPMVNTPGHLLGFFYTILMLLQGSLFFTRLHTNRWWMFTQEILVLIHGTVVAWIHAPHLWQMFFFGFAGLFVITQMHGLGLPTWLKWGFLASYIAAVGAVFSQDGFRRIHRITWIPITEYVCVFLVAGIIWGIMKLASRWQFRPSQVR